MGGQARSVDFLRVALFSEILDLFSRRSLDMGFQGNITHFGYINDKSVIWNNANDFVNDKQLI